MQLLLVSRQANDFNLLIAELERDKKNSVSRVSSAEEALALAENTNIDVVIAAEELSDSDGLTFVKKLIYRKPTIHCALVSPLSPDEFHEATEGLGLFMQLPVKPGASEAAQMMGLLKSIDALLVR